MEARIVRLEGVETPCLLLGSPGHAVPDEIQLDLDRVGQSLDVERRGLVTWRLQPSTANEDQPVYVEVFDE